MSNFIHALQQHRGGVLLDELDREVQKVIDGVRETGKSGEIKLTLKVQRLKGHPDHVLVVSDDLKVKVPAPPKDSSIFFADDDNRLHRSDPNQRKLPLEAVGDIEDGDVRRIG